EGAFEEGVPSSGGGYGRHPLGHEAGDHAMLAGDQLRVGRIQICDQIGTMHLGVGGHISAQNRNAERATQLARQIDEAGGLLRLAWLENAVGDVIDRREEESEREAAIDEGISDIGLARLRRKVTELPHGDGENGDADHYKDAAIDQRLGSIQKLAADDRGDGRCNSSGQQSETGVHRRQAEYGLGEEREDEGPAVETKAKRDEEEDRRRQLPVLENSEIDHGVLVPGRELPPEHYGEADTGDDREAQDERIREPVVAVAFLEDVLQ